MLISLIVPFFNSEKKSKRLLKTLLSIDQKDIEIILVDDGSTDKTYNVLSNFKKESLNDNVELIKQDNKGPGGARNAGLKIAEGQYVWFVDSDDDIKLEAINVVRENCDKEYDFIDFNIKSDTDPLNTMDLEEGEYTVNDEYRLKLLKKFGRICTKVIKRKFIIDNNILYPEYTLYEDNPLVLIYALVAKKFLKADTVGYIHHLDFESITRTKINPKSFDRLQTAVYGLERGLELANNDSEIKLLENMFIIKYLLVTTEKLLTKNPSKNWLITWRVMKQYRTVAKQLNIESSPFEAFKQTNYNQKMRAYFTAQWASSFLIVKDQKKYFNKIHKEAWE